MTEFKLPSGAILKVTVAPFTESRSLYQAFLEEMRGLKIDDLAEIDVNLFKDLACVALASKKVEAALWVCMKRVTYNDLKVTEDTFEPEAARDDYFKVCWEVARLNVSPFMKSLSAELSPILAMIRKTPA